MAAARALARDVILVVFDTLRRDAVASYGTPPLWGRGVREGETMRVAFSAEDVHVFDAGTRQRL